MFASRVPNKSNKLAGQCAAKLCTLLEAHLCGCRYKWPDFSRLHSSLAVLHKAVRIKKANFQRQDSRAADTRGSLCSNHEGLIPSPC